MRTREIKIKRGRLFLPPLLATGFPSRKSVGFEKPLATSEIHSREKNVEKKEELNSF